MDEVIAKLNLNDVWTPRYSPESKLKTEETRMILKGKLDVRQSRNTSLIEIWVYSEDKKEAAELANAIAEVYRESRMDQRKGLRAGGIKELRKQLAAQEALVYKAQTNVNQMRVDHNIPDLGGNSAMEAFTLNTQTLQRLEQQRLDALHDYDRFVALLTNIMQLTPSELRSSLATAWPDPQLNSLMEKHYLAEQSMIALNAEYGVEHPDVKRAKAVFAKVESQLEERIAGIIRGLQINVDALKTRLDEIEKKVHEANQKDATLAAIYRPYFDAKRELENLLRIRDALSLKITQEEIDASLPTSSIVEIVDKAEPGMRPVKPNKALNIILGVMVGLIVGVGLAFFIEYLDTSVKTIDDVERALQAPVLGVIPQNVGSLLKEGPESPHAEAYRVLRTNILFSVKGDNMSTLTVISGGAGEGKSTTLFNLAVTFAQQGQRILIVDSDLRRPSIHKFLAVSNTLGLTNVLLKQNTLEEVIQTTNLATLDFMPSGKLPSSSMGVLNSQQMRELIQDLKSRYDFVFFDSPPVLGVSDASILASEVDLVLQVIQYRRYPQQMTLRAKQMIQNVGGNLLGLVLNNINMSQDENYYYYSGYYHDYYSANKDEDDLTAAKAKTSSNEQAKLELKQKY